VLPVRDALASPNYAWILDLLYGHKPSITWAPAGTLPHGYQRIEQLAELPAGPGRSFLISLTTRRAAASALTSFNALRSGPKRAVRRTLAIGLRAGLAQPMLRRRIDIGVQSGLAADQHTSGLLTKHLAELLGVHRVAVAVSGGGGPYRKPVIQAFSISGTPLGYTKVGWNGWTSEGVRREAAVMEACSARAPQFGVPALLGLSQWQGLNLLTTAPLPGAVRAVGIQAPLPAVAVLRQIGSLSPGFISLLDTSPWWLGLRRRIDGRVRDAAARAALRRAAGQIELRYGNVPLEFCFSHGDFVPWNMARLDQRLYIWDWENSAPNVPLGFDALHYYFQVGFVGRGLPLQEATALASRLAQPALRELGLSAANCGLIAVLHLLELFLRHEEARAATGTADGRFSPDVARVVEHHLSCLEAADPRMGRVA
jgi:hypothetical protein